MDNDTYFTGFGVEEGSEHCEGSEHDVLQTLQTSGSVEATLQSDNRYKVVLNQGPFLYAREYVKLAKEEQKARWNYLALYALLKHASKLAHNGIVSMICFLLHQSWVYVEVSKKHSNLPYEEALNLNTTTVGHISACGCVSTA